MPEEISEIEKKRRKEQKKHLDKMNKLLKEAKDAKEAAEKARQDGDGKKEFEKKWDSIKGLGDAEWKKVAFMWMLPPIYGMGFDWWYTKLNELDELIDGAREALGKKPPDYEEANKKIKEAIDKKAEIEKFGLPQ